MRAQEKTIKGFTIFEVIIVMVLIGIVSGLAYPGFSQWRKDRAVKNSAIKIRGLFLGDCTILAKLADINSCPADKYTGTEIIFFSTIS